MLDISTKVNLNPTLNIVLAAMNDFCDNSGEDDKCPW